MGLSPRQEGLYVYSAVLYRQVEDAPGDFKPYRRLAMPAGVSLKADGSVPCYFESTPEADQTTPLGRTKLVNLLTLDYFHFELLVPVRDTDFLHLVGGPSSLVGNWWAVQGNTRTHGWRANKQVVYGKQDGPPTLLSLDAFTAAFEPTF